MTAQTTGSQYAQNDIRPVAWLEAANTVWYLVGQIDPKGGTRRIPITSVPFRIGRRSDLSLCIPSQTVSGVHAEINLVQGCLILHDLQSTNGTYVNGTPVKGAAALFENDVVQFAEVALRVRREAVTLSGATAAGNASDRAAALIHFDKLVDGNAAIPFFQPIVRLDSRALIGYEVLGRSRLYGLKTPREMFLVAAQLDMQSELSQMLRREGIRVGAQLPVKAKLFLNTHPVELAETGLVASLRELRETAAERPITLEIHEAAVTDTLLMRELSAVLRDLRMQLAYDDFGAGQARLVELVEVRPDVLKFDMRLVQGIHAASSHRQQMLAKLVEMVRELGIVPLAEGIQNEADGQACHQLAFELGQGYHFGRPATIKQFVERQ